MNKKQQLEVVRKMQENETNILGTKGNDYAGVDILKNFKEVSTICQLLNIDSRTIYGTHLFYIVLKLQRLCNLLTSGKTPKNESIEDTITDFRNYLLLLNCTILEQQQVEKENVKAVELPFEPEESCVETLDKVRFVGKDVKTINDKFKYGYYGETKK